MPKPRDTKPEIRRGMRALAAHLPKIAAPAMRKRGFTEAAILSSWRDIAGPALADSCLPERLAFARGAREGGTLHLRAAGAAALEIQHRAPLLIERINRHFGYRAVARITLSQGPIPAPPARRARPSAADQAAASAAPLPPELNSDLQEIADDGLRGALTRLAQAVARDGATHEK